MTAMATLRELMVQIALKEVGVREEPKNSNRGKRVQEYQAATWLDGTGWAWCAAFVDWVIRESLDTGHPVPKGFTRPLTAGAWDYERWADKMKGKGVIRFEAGEKNIEPGDILVYTFSHIGLAVAKQRRGSVETVEGNTDSSGSREGGGVYQQTRKLSLIRDVIRITF